MTAKRTLYWYRAMMIFSGYALGMLLSITSSVWRIVVVLLFLVGTVFVGRYEDNKVRPLMKEDE